jgi:hypothetical protein
MLFKQDIPLEYPQEPPHLAHGRPEEENQQKQKVKRRRKYLPERPAKIPMSYFVQFLRDSK